MKLNWFGEEGAGVVVGGGEETRLEAGAHEEALLVTQEKDRGGFTG